MRWYVVIHLVSVLIMTVQTNNNLDSLNCHLLLNYHPLEVCLNDPIHLLYKFVNFLSHLAHFFISEFLYS